MSKSSSSNELPDAKRLAALQAVGKHTKTSAVQILMQLQSNGLLDGDAAATALKKDLQTATEMHANTMTPYGTVVQEIQLDAPKLPKWEICHPYAFLWHLTVISAGFQKIMHDITAAGTRTLRLIIYADELTPGNPYRPEKSRTLMCIYWAIVDWPSWMLSRTFAWPCFSILRSTIIHSLPGGMSYLARVILRIFFPVSGDSMDSGILIQSPSGPFIVKCKFVGWLADLVGHKEITEWKGHGGKICCLTCHNLQNEFRGTSDDGTIGLDCYDTDLFDVRSDADMYEIIDHMIEEKKTMQIGEFKKLQIDLGINYLPNGLLFDTTMRDIYYPTSHAIRDWQHTLCQDGVANLIIAMVMAWLKEYGFPHAHVRSFMMSCQLPSKYGKPHENWLSDARLLGLALTSFSSIVLNLLPILFLYLEKYCADNPHLADIVRMFKLLYVICGVLSAGPDEATKYADNLRKMFEELHELMVKLEIHLKPKVHHMHHIVDGMVWLGKLLSCFVCERKHRTVKDSALHVFRHIEHTVLRDVVNKQCHQMECGIDLFKEMFLIDRRELQDASGVYRSRKAILHIGSVRSGDIAWLNDARCGCINMFFEVNDQIVVSINVYNNVDTEPAMFDERQFVNAFINPSEIVDVVTWYYSEPCILRVAIPPCYLMSL